ncbi:MAG: MFS transporter, partial [Methanosarcinaceae archaeon]|nr:MFS transporter [Methanosarcinaceae archaeon]
YLYIIPGMFFIAFSWAFLYVGSTRLVIEQNLEKATAAGLINSMIGAAGVFGALLGGLLSQSFGFRATMLVAALLSLVGFFLFILRNDAS